MHLLHVTSSNRIARNTLLSFAIWLAFKREKKKERKKTAGQAYKHSHNHNGRIPLCRSISVTGV